MSTKLFAQNLDNNRLDMQFSWGFAETFKLGHWMPLTITVSNRGADFNGHVDVEINSGATLREHQESSLYRQSLELANGARKRLYYTVLLSDPYQAINIRALAEGQQGYSQSVQLQQQATTAQLVLVLSRDADLDYLNEQSTHGIRVLYPHPELLPQHWQAYHGVSAIVLHGLSLQSLNKLQFQALQKWIAAGGQLAISGGPDYSMLSGSRLAQLLPAKPIGLVNITSDHADNPLAHLTQSTPSFSVHKLANYSGLVRYQSEGHPLLIEQQHGRGRIFYLSFDIARPPFAQAVGMKAFWLDLFAIKPQSAHAIQAIENTQKSPIPDAIRQQHSRALPALSTALAFLLFYIALLASAYQWLSLKQSKSMTISWLLPLLFAPIAYFLFGPLLSPHHAGTMMLNRLEALPNSAYAHLHIDLGLYSIRQNRLQLPYQGAEPVFKPIAQKRDSHWLFNSSSPVSLQPYDPSRDGGDTRSYVLHLLNGEDVVAFDLDGVLTEQTNSDFQLQLDNRSGRALHNTWLLHGDHVFAIGDIAVDEQWQNRLNHADYKHELQYFNARDFLSLTHKKQISGKTSALHVLIEQELKALREQHKQNKKTILLALIDSPLRFNTGHSWQHQHRQNIQTLLSFVVPEGHQDNAQ